MTRTRFWILTVVFMIMVICDVWQIIIVNRQYLIGGIILLAALAMLYIGWREGREGAGWGG